MNRRSFLSSAIASVAALAIDPERLLWTPGKLISIPASTPLPIRLDNPFGIDLEYSGTDVELSADDFYVRYIEPAYRHIAAKVASDMDAMYGPGHWDMERWL